ncbi:hypothetical protein [Allomesorhizobium alhagi]|uniref:hypothetical protein n=1 Tax=Allomesorhizobium alhagi TaxID=475067 RepID=UPI0002F05B17|nr:hypothetical protein [Mesorhizobium alhagi]
MPSRCASKLTSAPVSSILHLTGIAVEIAGAPSVNRPVITLASPSCPAGSPTIGWWVA